MRTFLPLVAVLPLIAAAAGAQTATLELAVGTVHTGRPLEAEVTLSGGSARGATRVDFFLDERKIATRRVEPGTHTLTFERTLPSYGAHVLRASSLGIDQAASFRAIPGWLSVLPPLLAIALALITRDVLVSLFLGIFGGALILNGWHPFVAFARSLDQLIVGTLTDPDRAAIILFTTLLGGMVGLITRSGGTHGIIKRLQPYATDSRRGQLATWMMGLLVFFDDYANTLIVGPTMRPITDKLRISREKLAYIVDSTAAPVVCLIPISTWVGFEIGLIGEAFGNLSLPFDGYTRFLYSIPYRFYPIFAVVTVGVLAWYGRDFGPMRRAEQRARDEGKVLADDAQPIADYSGSAMQPSDEVPKRARNALLPILTVVAVTIVGLYLSGAAGQTRPDGAGLFTWLRLVLEAADSYQALMWASAAGVLVASALPLTQRILKLRQAMDAMVEGFKAMMMALGVLVCAWALGSACEALGTAGFLVEVTSGALAPTWVPALTFVLAAGIAFATGSAWGAMAILTPLVIPICHNLTTNAGFAVDSTTYSMLLSATIASVLSGAVWGDHCSPISDTTILSSMATGCDHIAHVRTQLPYALSIGALAVLVGSVPVAFGVRPWISLAVGVTAIVLGVRFLGRRRDRATDA